MSDVFLHPAENRVAVLEMRRPPNNFFDEDLLHELADHLLKVEADDAVSVIVLASDGKHFCAGADLRHTSAESIRSVYRQAYRLFTGRKPIVAAVQGAAVGGGLGLAMAADFRVVSAQTRLTANFSQIGFHQGFGLSATLPAAIGTQKALELLYSGRSLYGEEALAIGLADRVATDVRAGAMEFAADIAQSAPLSLRAIRGTMRHALRADVASALEVEANAQAALLPTADFSEGVAAAVAKRPPQFIGA